MKVRELGCLNSIETFFFFFWLVEANFPLLPEKVSGMCETELEPSKYEIGLEGTVHCMRKWSKCPWSLLFIYYLLFLMFLQPHEEFSVTVD